MKRTTKFFIMPLLICLSSILFLQSASAHGYGWRSGYRSVYYDNCCNRNVVVYKKCYYWAKRSYCDCNGCPRCYRVKYCYYYPVKRIVKYNNCYNYNYNNCNSCCGYNGYYNGNGCCSYGYGYRYSGY